MPFTCQRGDLVTVAVSGDYGKPRPALVIQADLFAEHPSVAVLLLTGELYDAPLLRVTVQPTPENGLEKPSQVCVDKAATLPRAKIGQRVGSSTTRRCWRLVADLRCSRLCVSTRMMKPSHAEARTPVEDWYRCAARQMGPEPAEVKVAHEGHPPIRNARDHKAAVAEIDKLLALDKLTKVQDDRLEVLTVLVNDYEDHAFPVSERDPIELLQATCSTAAAPRRISPT